jgi:hypothetical protein
MILPLLAALALQDTACASPALCDLVARAAAANRALPASAYTALVETEVAVIGVRERWVDGPVSVDQLASEVRWDRGGTFTQHVVAARNATTTLPLNRIRYLLLGWIAPITTGDQVPIFARQLGMPERFTWPPTDTSSVYAPHPLGADRARYYRFTAADTVTWRDPHGIQRRAARVAVESLAEGDGQALVFDGALWLELEGLHLARLRGRLVQRQAEPTDVGLARLLRPPDMSFVDLQNAPVDGVWLPALQRFEWIQERAFTQLPMGGLRIVTRFRDVKVEPASVPDGPGGDVAPAYVLTSPPDGALGKNDHLFAPMGREAGRRELTDFDDVRLGGLGQPRGQSFGLVELYPGESIRFNRIEGIFAGAAVSYRPRSAEPGTELHLGLGYGFWDRQVRGDVIATWRRGPLALGGFAARNLDNTNEFMAQFANPSAGALLSRDNWDYVDRRQAGAQVGWWPANGRGDRFELSVAAVRDDSVSRQLETSPWVGFLRENRGIYEGDYARVRAVVDLRPDIGVNFVRDGVGLRVEGEVGSGSTIRYQRLVARVLARRNLSFMYLTAQLHGGKVWGDRLPPQQLLEMGGAVGIPGYDYKVFAGDVAALGRVRLSFPLPFLQQPIPTGKGFALPPFAPQVSFGVQAGWTDVTTPAAERAMAALGDFFDTGTGGPQVDPETGALRPASTASDGLRTSLDLRVTLFNDALGVAVAYPLDDDKGPTIIFVLGQQF